MHMNQDYERQISLRDLFFHVLYRWRSIIAAALIGAVLLGGYAWLRNRGAENASTEAIPDETELAASLQYNFQTSNELYQKMLDENIEYREKSILMKVNPYQVWSATAVYTVIMTDPQSIPAGTMLDPAVPIAATYPSLIYHDMDEGRLKSIYGETNLHYINEIVSIRAVSETGTFRINTIGTTKEMAEAGLAFFEEIILNASNGEIQKMGGHKLVRLSGYTRQVFNADIESNQIAVAKNIATYQTAITNNNNAINKGPVITEKKSGGFGRSIKLMTIIGFILGAMLLTGLYIVLYLLSGKLRESEELKDRFGVPVYGEFRHSRARRPGKGLDRIIEKWEFHRTGTEDTIVVNNLCALLRERSSEGTILLTGTIADKRVRELRNLLEETLGDSVQLQTAGNFLRNSVAIAEAGKAAAVILAEEKHVSETNDISRMLEVLAINQTPVIGAIVL